MRHRNISEWAAIAEIIGSIAVVISLIFVGFQLHRNTTELRAGHSNDLFDSMREIEMAMISSPQVITAYTKGWSGRREEMSEEEIVLFRVYLIQSITIWDQAYERRLDGSMSIEDYSSWKHTFVEYFRQGINRDDREYMRPWFQDAFNAEVDSAIEDQID